MEKESYYGLKQRADYAEGVGRLVGRRVAEAAEYRRARMLKGDKEKLRREFVNMLGWPLNMPEREKLDPIAVHTEILSDFNYMKCTRYTLEILPGLPFYGILFEPLKNASGSFVIALHGGWGSPEIAGGLLEDSANYNHMVERIVKRGITVFAPQLLLWKTETYGTEYDRLKTDCTLKQTGGSITSLEVFCIRRSLDYFISAGRAALRHIGMIGMSYGGMYTLDTAAADKRIEATVVSCYFNDRIRYINEDYAYFNQANTFLDAETAALVLPRRLYIEIPEKDTVFDYRLALAEIERLLEYAEAENCSDSLKTKLFSGGHELDKSDGGINFLADAIR